MSGVGEWKCFQDAGPRCSSDLFVSHSQDAIEGGFSGFPAVSLPVCPTSDSATSRLIRSAISSAFECS